MCVVCVFSQHFLSLSLNNSLHISDVEQITAEVCWCEYLLLYYIIMVVE